MSTFIVACESEQCENLGHRIEVPATTTIDGQEYPITQVFCGPCGNSIQIPTTEGTLDSNEALEESPVE